MNQQQPQQGFQQPMQQQAPQDPVYNYNQQAPQAYPQQQPNGIQNTAGQNMHFNEVPPQQQGQQNDDLVDGLFIDTVQTMYGNIDKLGIHRQRLIDWLMRQQVNDKGYLNVDLLTARNTGKKYAKLNTYVKPQNN